MKYAQGTKIDSEKSEREIKKVLQKFGATKRLVYEEDLQFVIMFEYENKRVRFNTPYPDPDEFTHTPTNKERSEADKLKQWQAECDRRWRALLLIIKAKLVFVQEGTRLFEDEFLANLVLQNNQTVAEYLAPQMKAIEAGKLPPLLPGIGETI